MPKPRNSQPPASRLPTDPKPKKTPLRRKPEDEPADVAAIRAEIQAFLKIPDGFGGTIGSARWGIYAFYDYDGEPIYVGQTREGFAVRIGRHLTGQRSDAVAKNVLDPFEVAEIRVWPMDLRELCSVPADADKKAKAAADRAVKSALNRAEFTVYCELLSQSSFGAVLNEHVPGTTDLIDLPPDFRGCIIPPHLLPLRKHPDIRIARRASTIAALARVISERKVGKRLRTILLTQAKRLEKLASDRLDEFAGQPEEDDSAQPLADGSGRE